MCHQDNTPTDDENNEMVLTEDEWPASPAHVPDVSQIPRVSLPGHLSPQVLPSNVVPQGGAADVGAPAKRVHLHPSTSDGEGEGMEGPSAKKSRISKADGRKKVKA